MSRICLEKLCGKDKLHWNNALTTIKKSLNMRLLLWDEIYKNYL